MSLSPINIPFKNVVNGDRLDKDMWNDNFDALENHINDTVPEVNEKSKLTINGNVLEIR